MKEILFGSEDILFLLEVIFRTFLMFFIILFSLRLLGKKGIKQLSVFELVVIIGLGSAAGDPMFYKEVGILSALCVFVVVVFLYKLATHLIFKYKSIENIMEGKPICLIKDGKFELSNFKKETLSQDEFFAELRLSGVSQLGQVEIAILEISGDISVFFYPPEQTKYGLPIFPEALDQAIEKITFSDWYACVFCGFTEYLIPKEIYNCPCCSQSKWIKASEKRRVN